MVKRIVLAFLVMLGAVLGTILSGGGVAAQDGTPPIPTRRPITDNEVNRVSKNLYCPVCENLPLDVCPTEACVRWREEVRGLLAEGYSAEDIERHFAERFGMKAVGVPLDSVGQFLTMGLPFLLFGGAGVAIVIMLFLWQRRARLIPEDRGEMPLPTREDDHSYLAQLEADLRDE
ncbi:MAG TPA: cytochrome c-type biogenesis protein CcmH [Aggregatilineales bacterium]|nr:cytochrome c-type biogenesis protein CcmH [Anaerolineales bacterium]HRE47676.1 cytochrome c-type biogenesis protein CcmH [Aggregatilineales bacterium]